MLKKLVLASFIFVLNFNISVGAEEAATVLAGHEEELGISKAMLYDYFLRIAKEEMKPSTEIKSHLTTPEDWAKRQRYVRKKMLESIGGLPERTPLHPKITGRLERDDYWVEKLIYESRPNFFVTANVYIPKKGKRPLPAILSPCGHSDNGKAYYKYQSLYISLAQKGFIVLSYDPLEQGERSEYVDPKTGKNLLEIGSMQHHHTGNLCFLTGTNLAQYRIWDGIRALDYLFSRDDVDTNRIGLTGNSGGGNLTTYISSLDDRIAVAAPSCWITTLYDRIATRKGADPEQDLANILLWGIDQADMIMPLTPKPLLICAAQQDFFPFKGTLQAFSELQLMYADFGAIEKVALAQADDQHGFSLPRRERVYAWMLRWLGNPYTNWREPEITIEPDSVLYCTKTGQVATSLGGETVWSLNKKVAEKIIPETKSPKNLSEFTAFKGEMRRLVQKVLVVADIPKQPQVHRFASDKIGNTIVEKIAIRSEAGIFIPALIYHDANNDARKPGVILIHEKGKAAVQDLAMQLAQKGNIVCTLDPRGIGETKDANTGRGERQGYYGWHGREAYFTYTSFIVGKPLLGLRVLDVLSSLNYFLSRNDVDSSQVTIYGHGHGGLIALFCAALDDRISKLIMQNTMTSYMSLINDKYYRWNVRNMVPDVLKYFDLPQVAACYAPGRVFIIDAKDSQHKTLDIKSAKREYKFTIQTFKKLRHGKKLTIRNSDGLKIIGLF
ncbi:MAG: alpha/beta fold hydrolase [Actinobacteria bacterium]|nr:alpha/beta fold hydrolase [Actinomycetota bacterium]